MSPLSRYMMLRCWCRGWLLFSLCLFGRGDILRRHCSLQRSDRVLLSTFVRALPCSVHVR